MQQNCKSRHGGSWVEPLPIHCAGTSMSVPIDMSQEPFIRTFIGKMPRPSWSTLIKRRKHQIFSVGWCLLTLNLHITLNVSPNAFDHGFINFRILDYYQPGSNMRNDCKKSMACFCDAEAMNCRSCEVHPRLSKWWWGWGVPMS